MTNNLKTVVAICIPDAEGRWLLARRSTQSQGGDLWSFPAGKVEPGERIVDALVREAAEELALSVKPVRRFAVLDQPQWGVRIHAWKCLPLDGTAITLAPRELSEAAWCTPEQMATDDGMLASTVLLAPWLPSRGERVSRIHGACDGEAPCAVGDHDYDYCSCPSGTDLREQEVDGHFVTNRLDPDQVRAAVRAGVSLAVVRHVISSGLELEPVMALVGDSSGSGHAEHLLAALRTFGRCPSVEDYDRWVAARAAHQSRSRFSVSRLGR